MDFLKGKKVDGIVKTKGKLVSVRTISYSNAVKSFKGSYLCEFDFDGKKNRMYGTTSLNKNVYKYVGRNFPAKYSIDHNKLILLIMPKDFEDVGMQFPDSLNWVLAP